MGARPIDDIIVEDNGDECRRATLDITSTALHMDGIQQLLFATADCGKGLL